MRRMSASVVSAYRVKVMSKTTRDEKAAALERWAEEIEPADVVPVDTSASRQLARLTDQREAPHSWETSSDASQRST